MTITEINKLFILLFSELNKILSILTKMDTTANDATRLIKNGEYSKKGNRDRINGHNILDEGEENSFRFIP